MNNVDTSQTITHVSHCTGYGGIDLALKRVVPSLRSISYCEIEAFAIANLVAKIEAGQLDAAPLWTDIKTFPFQEFHGLVDIYSAGFPCQPFSAAGKRNSTADPRHLYPSIAEGISRMQPTVVFLENVEGIISAKCADGDSVLLYVLRDLEERGYRATWGIFSACEVGAPHQRKRVFILAHHHQRLQGRNSTELQECAGQRPARSGDSSLAYGADRWPSRPAELQQEWEPPRTVADSKRRGGERRRDTGIMARNLENSERSDQERRKSTSGEASGRRAHGQFGGSSSQTGQIESAVGGNVNGTPGGMDYAELCESCDSRVDELRLLGNGVVPATVELAFRILWRRLEVAPTQ